MDFIILILGILLGVFASWASFYVGSQGDYQSSLQGLTQLKSHIATLINTSASNYNIATDGDYAEVRNKTGSILTRLINHKNGAASFISRCGPMEQYSEDQRYLASMEIEVIMGDLKYIYTDTDKTHVFKPFEKVVVPQGTGFKFTSKKGFICVFTLY